MVGCGVARVGRVGAVARNVWACNTFLSFIWPVQRSCLPIHSRPLLWWVPPAQGQ